MLGEKRLLCGLPKTCANGGGGGGGYITVIWFDARMMEVVFMIETMQLL